MLRRLADAPPGKAEAGLQRHTLTTPSIDDGEDAPGQSRVAASSMADNQRVGVVGGQERSFDGPLLACMRDRVLE